MKLLLAVVFRFAERAETFVPLQRMGR